MDAILINNINDLVKPDDWLYHLGDFSFRGRNAVEYRKQIKCKNVVLILGNHDPRTKYGYARNWFGELFSGCHNLLTLRVPINGIIQPIILCHWSMRVWDRCHYGSWHLYGHSHNSLPSHNRSFDVGVDAHNYKPVSIERVSEIMATKTFEPVDHHKEKDDD